ncbi:unnamed protein product [Caenorhabditis bovis]|uniref:WD repeat-containing protein 82 n=1 Tax=Caenorhabditis bovis TaxID=2654633 RepID=A0A8S1F5P2_9PELO|nr:unnamed protein product [Caenorhabditis bovis]
MTERRYKLDENVLRQLVCGKIYADNIGRVNCVAFGNDGLNMITATEDDSILLFDMKSGQKSRSVNSKKYGVGHIQFAANGQCAVHSSTKVDNTVRYLSLADNKYLRYFQGHTDKVTGLSVSPSDDMFLSVSSDKSIRLWDLRTYSCMGIMSVHHTPIAAFDPEGLIFAAGMNNRNIKLYDLRSFEKGPFSSFEVDTPGVNCNWTHMKFSPCGKYILLCTNGQTLMLIDSFTGALKHCLEGHVNEKNEPLEGSFSPCAKYVFCGSSNKRIYVWDIETGSLVHSYAGIHDVTPHIVQFSPKYLSFVSAGNKILYAESDHAVTGMDFSYNGLTSVVTTDDDSINTFDMTHATKQKNVNSKKYGVANIQFIINNTCAVHSSTKIDNKIRYLSLSDNKYVRYCEGHTEFVTSLTTSPSDEMFVSISDDKTLRLWDLRVNPSVGMISVEKNTIAAYDPEGLIFATAAESNRINLYDLRSFEKGPFSTFNSSQTMKASEWTHVKFSPCGKYILVCTNGPVLYLLDAFTGVLKRTLRGHENSTKMPLSAAITPDSLFLLIGSSDLLIYVYSLENGALSHTMRTSHKYPPAHLAFSSKQFCCVSASNNLILWTSP